MENPIELMFAQVEKKLNRAGLNGESLITIIKELDRIMRNANHDQLHVLADLFNALMSQLAVLHAVKSLQEGGEHGGNHGD